MYSSYFEENWSSCSDYESKSELSESIPEGAKDVELKPYNSLKIDPKTGSHYPTTWEDLSDQRLFKDGEPQAEDCRQVYLGDCWLQATLISILTQKGPKPIKDMFKDEGDIVKVRLYYPKEIKLPNGKPDLEWIPKYYKVQKRKPKVSFHGITYYYNDSPPWVHYLQAAVAKSNIKNKYNIYSLKLNRHRPNPENHTQIVDGKKIRDYSSVAGGSPLLAMSMIFGKLENFRFISYKKADFSQPMYQSTLSKVIKKQLYKQGCMVINFKFTSTTSPIHRGLYARHTYVVLDYITDENANITHLRLINPHNTRTGRKYPEKGEKGKGTSYSFVSNGYDNSDESFLLKFSTVCKHFRLAYLFE